MPTPGWAGQRVTDAIRFVLARDGGRCWLCHHPGASTIDHVQPKSTHPHLMWTPSNWRAAHRDPAGRGHRESCQARGCECPGNTGRGVKKWTAPPTRRW